MWLGSIANGLSFPPTGLQAPTVTLDAPNSTAVVVQWQVGYHVTCAVHHMTNSNIDSQLCAMSAWEEPTSY